MQAPTATDLARLKWHDFKQHFLAELQASGFSNEQLIITWDTMATYITLAWLYRGAIDDKDEETLRMVLEASDLDNKVQVLATWDSMSVEKKARFWRYARWFFNTVLC
jgi:hypothetical protein